MKEKDLSTTLDAYHALWTLLDKTRSTSKSVTVPKDALVSLLVDHSAMANGLWGLHLKRPLPRN